MNMLKTKKGNILSTAGLSSAITAIVLLVVVLYLYASLVPTAQTAGNSLCNSGAPLGSLFNSSGVVFIIVMAALILAVVFAFLPGHKKK